MTIEEKVLETLRILSADKKKEVLAFAESLKRNPSDGPLESLEGLWADLDINISEEDIGKIRREMWANFPRDVEP